MTHAPQGDGGGGGAEAEKRHADEAAGRTQPEDAGKQIEELLPPSGARQTASVATVSSDDDAFVPSTQPSIKGSSVQGQGPVGDAPSHPSFRTVRTEDGQGSEGAPGAGSRTGTTREDGMPTPPDGGWGWVVVFASFMIHVINDGVTYSFGIFYYALINYFESGRGETAWILSILVGVTLCSGPISSAFVNRYGCRPVTIAGALLGAASLAVSVFAPNVQTLYVTIGIGAGFGFGLVYLPAIVAVTCYFERYRSLATGIAVCGSGLGTFVFAPLTKELVEHLGWRYALLCISVMVLSCVFYGALFRPLPPDEVKVPLEMEQAHLASVDELRPRQAMASTDIYLLKEIEQPLHSSHKDINAKLPHTHSNKLEEEMASGPGSLHRPRSVGHLAVSTGAMLVPPRVAQRGAGPAARLALSQPALAVTSMHSSGMGSADTRLATPSMARRTGSGIMLRKDILYSRSVHNLQNKSTSHLHAEAARLLPDEPSTTIALHQYHAVPPSSANGAAAPHALHDGSAASGGRGDEVESVQNNKCCCIKLSPETSDTLREMLNMSLLKDPIFILFTISNFLTSIGYNIPYLYIAVQAIEREIDKDSAGWLLAAVGIANTVGRIVLGYVSDKPWVNRLLVYNLCLTICGIATAFSVLCRSFGSFLLYACVFGSTIGAYVGLTSVVLVDLLGLDKLTNAFGLLLLFQGIASFLGAPIAGWLYDAYLSYDPGFLVAGVTMALSGVMLFVIPPIQRRLLSREAAKKAAATIEMHRVNGNALAVQT